MDCFLRHPPRFLRCGISDIGFYCMCQGIHARSGCDVLRQSYGLMIIQHRIRGNQTEIVDGIFMMLFAVRDDCCQRCFAACSGCCGNGDYKRKLFVYFQQSFHLADTLVWFCNPCPCRLGTVHRGTAAKGNHSFRPMLHIQFSGFFHVLNRRICHCTIVYTVKDTCFGQYLFQKIRKPQGTDSSVRHDHNRMNLMLSAHICDSFH